MTFDEWVKTLDQDDEMYFRLADARIGWDAAKADSAQEIERLRRILRPVAESVQRAESLGRKVNDWVQYAKALERDAPGAVGVENARLRTALSACQAKIDSLMLEHCPEEMTPEQLKTWGEHQRPAREHEP